MLWLLTEVMVICEENVISTTSIETNTSLNSWISLPLYIGMLIKNQSFQLLPLKAGVALIMKRYIKVYCNIPNCYFQKIDFIINLARCQLLWLPHTWQLAGPNPSYLLTADLFINLIISLLHNCFQKHTTHSVKKWMPIGPSRKMYISLWHIKSRVIQLPST